MGRWSGPGPYFADVDGFSPRARLRVLKRAEAETRNEATAESCRREYRRQFELAAAAPAPTPPPSTKTRKRKKRGKKTAA